MGYFSNMSQEDYEDDSAIEEEVMPTTQQVAAAAPAQSQQTTQPAAKAQTADAIPQEQSVQTPQATQSVAPQQPAQAQTPEETKAGDDAKAGEDDDAKRKAHEEAEAKRKAEFEARQAEKKKKDALALAALQNMSDSEVIQKSMERISGETERLTRRNMKECVSEYIQTLCVSDAAFARMAMHPKKSMIHCVWYINRKAEEFAKKELDDNGMKPDRNGIYGCDVPDDLVYQWAEEYFRDPDAKEDQEEEEKFVPRPYVGGSSRSKSKTAKTAKKVEEKKKMPKPAPKKPAEADSGQITFDMFAMEQKAS